MNIFIGIGAATEEIYEINSLKNLTDLRDTVNNGKDYKDYIVKLNVDIDISGETNWHPIGDNHDKHIFKGTFDGQGHTISNLKIHDNEGRSGYAEYWDHGLFGATEGATIKNLVLKNVDAFTEGYTSGTITIGSLIGWMKDSYVSNCSVSGKVSAGDSVEYVGGLIGWIDSNGKIDNCSLRLNGDITSGGTNVHTSYLGGLIGSTYRSNISNCFLIGNDHNVSGTDSTNYVGGLIAHFGSEGYLENCFVLLGNGMVTGGGGTFSDDPSIGGLIGECSGSVCNCFVSGKVIGSEEVEYIGGLIGYAQKRSNVVNCYTTQEAERKGDNDYSLGGLVGDVDEKCKINHCVALNQFVKQKSDDNIGRVTGSKSEDTDISQNYGWNRMLVNGRMVTEEETEENKWRHGKNISSRDFWKNLTFWQNVFGTDSISYDGTKIWTIDKYNYESDKSWGLPYLTYFGKPTDDEAKNIQYLNPYICIDINSVDDLKAFRDLVNSGKNDGRYIYVTLHTNLDLGDIPLWDPIGYSEGEVEHGFIGEFEGNGYTISNMTSSNGLFGVIDCAVLTNLTMKNVSVFRDGFWGVGGLVGVMKGSTLQNCMVTGNVSCTDSGVGGLVGLMKTGEDAWGIRYSQIHNCSANCTVSGDLNSIGGLVGEVTENGIVSNCSVNCTISGRSHVGGLVGEVMENGIVSNCSINCTVSGNGDYVGGLVGEVMENSIVSNCSVNCTVSSGGNYVSGLVGEVQSSNISNCSVNCTVSGNGDYVGGLVGEVQFGNISNSSANCTVSGRHHVGGLVGSQKSSYVDVCFAYGTVNNTGSWVGGLVGEVMENGIVSNCSANCTVSGAESSVGGLVGEVMENGIVSNCSVNSIVFGDADSVGGLVGKVMENGIVSNCSVNSIVSGDGNYVGGLIGRVMENGIVSNCFVDCTVSGVDIVGGLISYLERESSVSNCFVNCTVSGNGKYVGGLIGLCGNYDAGCSIRNCYAYGTVNGTGSLTVGGLIGELHGGSINDCSANCTVSGGRNSVGGLIGEMSNGNIINCFASGFIVGYGNVVGGLVGEGQSGNISSCSVNCTISSDGDYAGGLVGYQNSNYVDTCFAYGTINCTGSWVGELVGYSDNSDICNCSAYGEIYGVNSVGGLIGEMSNGSIINCFASGFIVCNGYSVGGLVGGAGEGVNVLNSLALNHYIIGNSSIQRVSSGSLQTMENTFAWNDMTLNGNLVHEGGNNGTNATSSEVWKNLTFWQSVFGADNISDDGSKMWNIIKLDDDSLWCLPYLTHLGKPSDKDAEKIQYLNPGPSVIYPTNITYNDGQYANKQALSQNKLPRITLYKDIFDITKAEGSHQSFSLDTSAPWENHYLWQNNSHPIMFSDVITENVSWNSLESVDAMKNQNITFALGDENQTSIPGTERNVSVTVENYLQSYTNNSLDKTRTTDGWFFDTPYTVSLAVRPGPEAYHACQQRSIFPQFSTV